MYQFNARTKSEKRNVEAGTPTCYWVVNTDSCLFASHFRWLSVCSRQSDSVSRRAAAKTMHLPVYCNSAHSWTEERNSFIVYGFLKNFFLNYFTVWNLACVCWSFVVCKFPLKWKDIDLRTWTYINSAKKKIYRLSSTYSQHYEYIRNVFNNMLCI